MEGFFVYVANKYDAYRKGSEQEEGYKVIKVSEFKDIGFWRAVLAEFLATLLFVFLGCASAAWYNDPVAVPPSSATIIRIAFCFGLAIMVGIQMFGHVSGGHINPAVSIAMAVTMQITPARALFYTIAQCIGGICGAFILKGCTPDSTHSNLGVTGLTGITAGQGFGVELILTFVLVMSIFGTTDPNRTDFGSPSLAIGLTVAMCHLAGIPLTGASMNPARSLGSAVASDNYVDHWVYWVGPILGGILAGLVYKFLISPYRGWLKPDDAIQKMLTDGDSIVVPRQYLKDDGHMKVSA